MKPADKMEPKNIDINGKTHPTTTVGVASPRTNTEGETKRYTITKGDPKKAQDVTQGA